MSGKWVCASCGHEFACGKDVPKPLYFCVKCNCFNWFHVEFTKLSMEQKWRIHNAYKRIPNVLPIGALFKEHEACYRKEARAILEGKKKGVNHCVRLAGDDENV